MINEYNVKYYLGTKKNTAYELLVLSHDEDEARKIVVAQVHNRHGGSAKVNVISIDDENRPAVDFLKQPVVSLEPPQPKKPVNLSGCIYPTIATTLAFVFITGILCSSPIWATYILIKLLGG